MTTSPRLDQSYYIIEDEAIALLSNLLTINRRFELLLPSSCCHAPLPFLRKVDSENYTILDLHLEIVQLARVCTDEVKQLHSTRFHDNLRSGWRIEQIRISEADKTITTFNAAYAHQTILQV